LNNAVMHRDYESNAPVKFYEFADRIEISNPGGLYGAARPDNFPHQNDYRNPVIAESMKIMGYVNRFNRGIETAIKELEANGNPKPVFEYNLPLHFGVTIYKKVLA
jgi:ATP-dependent DNA helicase RecG